MAHEIVNPAVRANPRASMQPGSVPDTIPGGVIRVTDLRPGMVRDLPREQLPAGSADTIINGRIRDEYVGVRPGTTNVGQKPNSNTVLKLFLVEYKSGAGLLVRIDNVSAHVYKNGTWRQIEGSFGFGNSKITLTEFFGSIYLANGYEKLWKIDPLNETLEELTNSQPARYVVNFFDRLLVAYVQSKIGGTSPTLLEWTVNGEDNDWIGEGSGFQDIGGGEITNPITGLAAFDDVAIVMRQKSIEHITKQPFSIAPFRFKEVFNGLGSDLPYTTTKVPGGVVFADARTRNVYFYAPGSAPQPLANNVHRELFKNLDYLQVAEGSYDPYENEYHLGLSFDGQRNFDIRWVFNLRTGAVSYDTGPNLVSTLAVFPSVRLGLNIDNAPGLINQDGRVINTASDVQYSTPRLHFGTLEGNVVVESDSVTQDYDNAQVQFTYVSQDIGDLVRSRTIQELHLFIETTLADTVTIEYSRNKLTWTKLKTGQVPTDTRYSLRNLKVFTGKRIFWRLKTTARGFKLYEWWARMLEGPLAQ